MTRCSARILQEAGAGIDFEEVEGKLESIHAIIKHIEAMACEAIACEALLKCVHH